MKLAEALVLRADIQRKLERLQSRVCADALIQEGDEPAEEPSRLIEEFETLASQLQGLIYRINATNLETRLDSGESVTAALARRDVLQRRLAMFQQLAQAATLKNTRYSASEVRFEPTVNVAEIRSRHDKLAKEHRELDAAIQAVNWKTELLETSADESLRSE